MQTIWHPVAKSDTLKYTEDGEDIYVSGDYYLEYDNLRHRITLIDSLDESSYNNKHALSARQGYVLNQNKLARDGSQTFTGTTGNTALRPETNGASDLGTSALRWKTLYVQDLNVSGTIKMNSGAQFVYSGSPSGNSASPTVVRLEATSNPSTSTWNGYENKTLVVAW